MNHVRTRDEHSGIRDEEPGRGQRHPNIRRTHSHHPADDSHSLSATGRQIRVLGSEEDIARQILKLCTPEQQKITWIDKTAPGEVPGPNQLQAEIGPPLGLPFSGMSNDQKKLLQDLLNEYLKNLPASITTQRRAELEQAGLDKIHFAWWGGSELHEPHHYRVQGPTFVIEYNNTQNNANHVHSMWRNLKGDFNISRPAAN